MRNTHKLVVAALAVSLTTAGCGAAKSSADGAPSKTQIVVHTGPGGGSDVFAREVVKLMQDDKVISSNWPVLNQTAGSSIGAMSYLKGRTGHNDVIAAITPTWIVTPMTLSSSSASVEDLQPIAGVLVEPQVVAVRADSPYKTAKDFTDAAKADPDSLVQVGGSVTATDSLTGKALQAQTGAKWKFLTFSDSGERISALLRGDAQMMIGATSDFSEQVKAGKVRIVAVVGDERLPAFDGVSTLKEQGFDTAGLPQEFRGFMGPPDMSDASLSYYEDKLRALTETDDWSTYADENGDVTDFMPHDEFATFLAQQSKTLGALVKQLGLAS